MADRNWEISAGSGLGPLRLGMSRDEVAAYDAIFGEVTKRQDEGGSTEAVIATLEPLIGVVPGIEEQIRELRESRQGVVIEFRRADAPILRYRQDRLGEILLAADCRSAHFEGTLLFEAESRTIGHLLTARNGGAKFHESELAFDRLGLLLQGYVQRDSTGAFAWTTIAPDEQDERLVKIVTHAEIQETIGDYRPIEPL